MSSRPLGCSTGSTRRFNLLFRTWETTDPVGVGWWGAGRAVGGMRFVTGGSAEKRGDLLTLLSAVKRGDLCI